MKSPQDAAQIQRIIAMVCPVKQLTPTQLNGYNNYLLVLNQ